MWVFTVCSAPFNGDSLQSFEQLQPRECAAGGSHQRGKQLKLGRGQPDGLAPHVHRVRIQIEYKVAAAQHHG